MNVAGGPNRRQAWTSQLAKISSDLFDFTSHHALAELDVLGNLLQCRVHPPLPSHVPSKWLPARGADPVLVLQPNGNSRKISPIEVNVVRVEDLIVAAEHRERLARTDRRARFVFPDGHARVNLKPDTPVQLLTVGTRRHFHRTFMRTAGPRSTFRATHIRRVLGSPRIGYSVKWTRATGSVVFVGA